MFQSETIGREGVWRRRLERFQKAGLSVARFCRREGVSVPSFYQWRKRLGAVAGRTPGQRQPAEPATFLPVTLRAAHVEVRLPNGVRVQLPAGDDVALRVVIDAAGRLPAAKEADAC